MASTERQWYRRDSDGQRGYLVDGKTIRLDRAAEVITEPLSAKWTPERELRPLTKIQIAQIAFEADVRLCHALGHRLKYKAWIDLPDEGRIAFMEGVPLEPKLRQRLYDSIVKALS